MQITRMKHLSLVTSYFWLITATSINQFLLDQKKSNRVTRSVLESETIELSDAFDLACAIKHEPQKLLTKEVTIMMFTNSLSLSDVTTKASLTTERRLMIDTLIVKKAYKTNALPKLRFIRSQFSPADALTKKKNGSIIHYILKKVSLDHLIDQWILRDWFGFFLRKVGMLQCL